MKFVFITGSSRSGTTMMGRLLGNHQHVFTFPELHFFEQLVSEESFRCRKQVDFDSLTSVCSRLVNVIKRGYLDSDRMSDAIDEESQKIILNLGISNYQDLYTKVLPYFINDPNVQVAVEQTPRYIFSISALMEIDGARVVHMVRDPRSVLVSQKYKWKRKFLGASQLSLFESIRSFVSYDPIITSLIWRKATRVARNNDDREELLIVKFESLIASPDSVVDSICKHVGISYSSDLLLVPVVGSSTRANSSQLGINAQVIDSEFIGVGWFERRLCEFLCGKEMSRFNYKYRRFSLIEIIFLTPIFALIGVKTFVKGFIIFLFNRHRYQNVLTSVVKRLF